MRAVKAQIQASLCRLGIYHRVKTSPLYSLYWRIADRSIVDQANHEVEFYRSVLTGFKPRGLIFDIGANYGSKTNTFLRLGARVVAVEPDETNKKILEEKFLKYRLIGKPVTIVAKAVSDRQAVETMWVDEPGSAKNTFSRKWVDTLRSDTGRFGHAFDFAGTATVSTTTLEQLFLDYGVPFFIKIDVEGYEPNVLRGLHRPVPFLSFEVNLPEFRPEGIECIELLEHLSPAALFNYTGDCAKGLALHEWVGPDRFLEIMSKCGERSIEVFGKL